MDNLLLHIMAESFDRNQSGEEVPGTPRPFITISREYGCQANILAQMLRERLEQKGQHWRIMNKEIIFDAARELHLHPDKIAGISEASNRSQLDEVMHAMSSRFYKSDRKIRQTVASVVLNTALSGNVIIVGRGGAAITQGLQPAIHLHMIAPIDWRIQQLMLRNQLKRAEILKKLTEIDHKRYKVMRDNIKWAGSSEYLFDLTINCSMVSQHEVLKLVLSLAADRGIF